MQVQIGDLLKLGIGIAVVSTLAYQNTGPKYLYDMCK